MKLRAGSETACPSQMSKTNCMICINLNQRLMIVGTNYLPRVVRFVAWIQLLELPQLYEGGYITTCIAI
jgi:hypothetical protein